jgi:hypothetical protein
MRHCMGAKRLCNRRVVGYIFPINACELDYAIYLAWRHFPFSIFNSLTWRHFPLSIFNFQFYFAQRAQRPQSFLLIVVVDKYRLIRDADLSRMEAFSIFHFPFSIH